MEALVTANVSHNDIKPSNYLADWPEGEFPTISNLRIYLTDFGMVDQAGGTPIYCSPDILTGAKPGVSDMYSMGRLFLFLIVENRELFYSVIFMSIPDKSLCNQTRKLFESFPIICLIKEMTHVDPVERISIADLNQKLSSAEFQVQIITTHLIFSMYTELGLDDVIDEIELSLSYPEEQVTMMLKER